MFEREAANLKVILGIIAVLSLDHYNNATNSHHVSFEHFLINLEMIITDLQPSPGTKNNQGNTTLWQEKLVSDIVTVMVTVQLRPVGEGKLWNKLS